MNQTSKLMLGLGCLGLALAATPAQAQLQLLNGDFSLNATQGNAPVDWYVPNANTGGSWWISTWVGPTVSPNGTSVLGLSFMTSTNWAYQNIGTDSTGSTGLTVGFDLGSFTDAGSARNLGVTVSLYQSASFTAANGTDINGAAGVTLLGNQSVASGLINAGAVVHETLSFDLTGANTTDALYLRFVNYQVDATQPWAAIDNVTITPAPTPEPATLALGALGGVAFLLGRRARR
jgi:hypothetical protein